MEREVAARKDAVKAYDALALKHHALDASREATLRSADATHSRFRESDRSATSAWYAASSLERGFGYSAA